MLKSAKSEVSLVWEKFMKKAAGMDQVELLTRPNAELKELLTVKYSELLAELKKQAAKDGKTGNALNYTSIKLNRVMAILKDEGVIEGDFEVVYKDEFTDFPQMNKEDFELYPSQKAINKIRCVLIDRVVKQYNKTAAERGRKPINSLSALGLFLKNSLKINEQNTRLLTKIYGENLQRENAWNVK